LLGTQAGAAVLDEFALAKLTSYPECTWHGDATSGRDDLPLNCISPRDAEAVCRAVGGQLPSEAQWEYAARGHGAGWLFPWGDQPPSCCRARVSRLEGSELEALGLCPGIGPTEADTGVPNDCEGADVSIDGAVDLAGNLMEATLDSWLDWSSDTECWPQRGILRNPSCKQDAGLMVGRGGDWTTSAFNARSTLRKKLQRGAIMTTLGFRCAYEDVP
jgi:formylglycine-generating enzyme required for sulfatase activity